jgi:hypothetical protein
MNGVYGKLRLGDMVEFDYHGQFRRGRVENKVAGIEGPVLTIEIGGVPADKRFRSFKLSKIKNLQVV